MKNKLLIKVVVPSAELNFDVYVPINKKIGTIKKYLLDAIMERTNGNYSVTFDNTKVINQDTGLEYENNKFVYESDLKNGSTIVFI